LIVIDLGYYDWIMNFGVNFFLGLLAIAYGLYWLIKRRTAPEDIEKLQSMIERNGENMGHSIHLFGHTILPVIVGLLLLFTHFQD